MKYLMIISLLLAGCASVSQVSNLQEGMNKGEIEAELGRPNGFYSDGSVIHYKYKLSHWEKLTQYILAIPTLGLIFYRHDWYELDFQDNKLVAISEIGPAEAPIQINYQPVSSNSSKPGYCSGIQPISSPRCHYFCNNGNWECF